MNLKNNYKNIITKVISKVALITLNRPEVLNALSKDLITDLNGDVFNHKVINKPQLMELKSSVDNRKLQSWIVTPQNFPRTRRRKNI